MIAGASWGNFRCVLGQLYGGGFGEGLVSVRPVSSTIVIIATFLSLGALIPVAWLYLWCVGFMGGDGTEAAWREEIDSRRRPKAQPFVPLRGEMPMPSFPCHREGVPV